ncbi:histidine kinase [Chitinophaga horti]|uniref:Histidine kinase n=1 Tax=Chitinophaga horti TaxID=2920382 RepID=A0ABY6J2L4_9BACT|nr:sensor histidine kinase [Chitinophaga horti]UYQ92606.1 histidine kinase [Chitinophaga horti]
MKAWMKPIRSEWITVFALIPVISVMLNHLLFGDRLWRDAELWLYSVPSLLVAGLASWYVCVAIMHWLRIRYPEMAQTAKRLLLLALSYILLTSLTFIGIFYIYHRFHLFGYTFHTSHIRVPVFISVSMTLIATAFWEAEYVLARWKESLAEKELLQQQSIFQEFESLKNQVNPHFLFNCFNTLSSLISEDARQADAFLNELSKVYRYLLRSNEDGLSTLENELKFIRSYFELLRHRYGDAVQLQIEVDKKYMTYLLPSLSLQLLVENAVKHNIVSRQQPLVVDIFTTAGNKLAVNNNLQLKLIKAPSNKIGIRNIQEKYQLLKQDGFQVLEDARNFTVVLPLIWSHSDNRPTCFDKHLIP